MRYSLRVMSAVFFLSLCLLSGCGGGGGGGGSSGGGGTPPDPIVYVGTTAFDPATSRDLGDHVLGFVVPCSWSFKADAGPITYEMTMNQTFETSQVVVSGVVLPCYRVRLYDEVDLSSQYEWWAVGVDHGLYRMTRGAYDHLPGPSDGFVNDNPDAPVLLSQARLIVPPSLVVGTSWSFGSSAGMELNNSALGHTATRTIVATGVSSPSGFPGCVQVKLVSGSTEWFEWWMPDRGLVEVGEYDADDAEWNLNFRDDFTASG